MTHVDRHGLAVTCADERTVVSLNEFMVQVLRYGNHWGVVLGALAREPCHPLVCVLAADFEVAREDMSAAMDLLATAKNNLDGANVREAMYVEAWTLWLTGHAKKSLDVFYQLAHKYPQDLFALKRGQLVAFLLGLKEDMLKLVTLDEVVKHCTGQPYYHGMVGFALEQNLRLTEAEEAGRRGTEIESTDAWSHHAVAHALYFQTKWTEGIEWMLSHAQHWRDCMSFMYTHNYFHLGLFYLGERRYDDFEKLYDTEIWNRSADVTLALPASIELSTSHQNASGNDDAGESGGSSTAVGLKDDTSTGSLVLHHLQHDEGKEAESARTRAGGRFPLQDKGNAQDQLGALGILWKYEMRIGEEGNKRLAGRWASVLGYVSVPTPHFDLLLDLIVVKALARVGRADDLKRQLEGMRQVAEASPDKDRRADLEQVWLTYAQAVADADPRIGNDPAKAALAMAPIMDRIHIVGGSAEQREVLHEHYVQVLCRCGRAADGEEYAIKAKIVRK